MSLLSYYHKMGFHLESVNPRSKTPVNLPVEYCLANGGNVALGYEQDSKWLVLDLDTHKINHNLKSVFARTPVVRSPKGYGILVLSDKLSAQISPVVKIYKDAIHGTKEDLVKWMKASDAKAEWLMDFLSICSRIGFWDATFIKGLSPDVDSHSYYLLPPSVTCLYEGQNGITVKLHSSQFEYCNSSPDNKHRFIERIWVNQFDYAMTFGEFAKAIGMQRLEL